MSEKTIVKNLDFAEYRAKLDYISVSELKSFIDSPFSYYKRYIQGIRDNKKSSAMTFGSLVHCLVLEPDLFDKEYLVTEVRKDKRSKVYQAVLEHAGSRECVSPADLKRARECAKTARPIIESFGESFQAELSYFYEGPRGFLGMKAKGRFDGWSPCHEAVIDVKTTNKLPTYKNVLKAMFDFKYHLQVAWYLDLHKAITGKLPKSFQFIFVQSEFPYASQLYKVDREIIQLGRDEYRKALRELRDTLNDSREESNFPRMTDQNLVLKLPDWKRSHKIKEANLLQKN